MPKMLTRNEEGNYIMMKGSTQPKVVTVINTYAPTSEHLNIISK